MHRPGDLIKDKEVKHVLAKKGMEGFEAFLGIVHSLIENSHEEVRLLIVHGRGFGDNTPWIISNNLAELEELEIARLMQNSIHKDFYYGKDYDNVEDGVKPWHMVDFDQIIT